MTSHSPAILPLTPASGSMAPPGTNTPQDARAAYAPPRLHVYGDLAQITAAGGSKGKKDHPATTKTGF